MTIPIPTLFAVVSLGLIGILFFSIEIPDDPKSTARDFNSRGVPVEKTTQYVMQTLRDSKAASYEPRLKMEHNYDKVYEISDGKTAHQRMRD